MISRLWLTLRTNFAVTLVTFEVFWIVVFLLNRIGSSDAGGVPQFVYVNF